MTEIPNLSERFPFQSTHKLESHDFADNRNRIKSQRRDVTVKNTCTCTWSSKSDDIRGAQLLSSESLVQKVHQFITVYG